jgi:hypothetical protein
MLTCADIEPQETIASLHATYNHFEQSTMRFKGKTRSKPVCSLLDGGSIHNFIDLIILIDQSITIEDTLSLIIKVANGVCMVFSPRP